MAYGYALLFSYPDFYANISVDKAVADADTFAITNLLDNKPQKLWRSNDDTDQAITCTFDQELFVDTVVLWNHNVSTAGTIQIQMYSNSGATLEYNITHDDLDVNEGWLQSSSLTILDNHFVAAFAGDTVDTVKLTISDSTNAAEYIQAGKILAGERWQPAVPFEWGRTLQWIDPSDVIDLYDGSRAVALRKNRYRVGRLKWDWITQAEADQIYNHSQFCGTSKAVLMNMYPDESSDFHRAHRILGLLTAPVQISHLPGDFYSATLEFVELL